VLGGSGTTAKVPEEEIACPGPPAWEKLRLNSDLKGPPVTPPCVPGVHSPTTARSRKFGVVRSAVIDVAVKVPKTALPKVRLLGMVVLNDTLPKLWRPMPAKMPVPNVEVQLPSVMAVAVVMLPVFDVEGLRATKPSVPSVLACTLVVAAKEIASTDTAERVIERIPNLLIRRVVVLVECRVHDWQLTKRIVM
jgi:hypothetical protein